MPTAKLTSISAIINQVRSTNIQRIFKEPVLLFTASRYVGYGLVVIRGLLLAKFLGPTLFGTWGFITLLEQYLTYSNFGIQYSVTVKLSTQDSETQVSRSQVISAAFLTSILFSLILFILGLWVQTRQVELFEKYTFNRYAILLGLWVGLVNLQQVLINTYRVYNKLLRIAISELLVAITPLIAVFFFRGEALIIASLASAAGAALLSIAVFTYKPPFKWTLQISRGIIHSLLIVGLSLLVYNVSYNLITMVGRTILSAYYSNEQMGFYSFANSITYATLLGFKAILWVAFPSILHSTRSTVANEEAAQTVQKVNNLFNTSVFLSIFALIIVSPVLFLFLPQFAPSFQIFSILLLTQAMLLLSFGYNSLAIARNEQMKVAGISIITVVIVGGLGFAFALLKLPAVWIASAVFLGSFIYTLLQVRLGFKVIQPTGRLKEYFPQVFSPGTILAVWIAYIGTMLDFTFLSTIIALAIYILTNRGKVRMLWQYAIKKFS
ncbi:MAG TPA: hypothetical protein PKM21_01995 [Anaerolineales bacterium]|nr:hypothetical protein [Anaerolineales bacterium]